MNKIICILLFVSLLVHCQDRGKTNASLSTSNQKSTRVEDTIGTIRSAGILNNIIVKPTGGLEITQAFLSNESGKLIGHNNMVQQGEPAYLNLVIKKGWNTKKGMVSIGASQSITTNIGEPVLQSSDLFAGSENMAKAEGSHLRLKVVITKSRPDIRYYIVNFRVWDKRGNGEVTGSYKLFLEGKKDKTRPEK